MLQCNVKRWYQSSGERASEKTIRTRWVNFQYKKESAETGREPLSTRRKGSLGCILRRLHILDSWVQQQLRMPVRAGGSRAFRVAFAALSKVLFYFPQQIYCAWGKDISVNTDNGLFFYQSNGEVQAEIFSKHRVKSTSQKTWSPTPPIRGRLILASHPILIWGFYPWKQGEDRIEQSMVSIWEGSASTLGVLSITDIQSAAAQPPTQDHWLQSRKWDQKADEQLGPQTSSWRVVVDL